MDCPACGMKHSKETMELLGGHMTRQKSDAAPIWHVVDEVSLHWYPGAGGRIFCFGGDPVYEARITGGPTKYKLVISRGYRDLKVQGFDGTLIPEWTFPTLEEAKAHAKAYLAHKGVKLE